MYYEINESLEKNLNDLIFIEAKSTYLKDWYKKAYPDDEIGEQLKENLSFYDLFKALDNYEDVYEFAGIEDSIIRERLFEKLSKIMRCDYDVIYYQWLQAGKIQNATFNKTYRG